MFIFSQIKNPITQIKIQYKNNFSNEVERINIHLQYEY
jgi:hypothetical protein